MTDIRWVGLSIPEWSSFESEVTKEGKISCHELKWNWISIVNLVNYSFSIKKCTFFLVGRGGVVWVGIILSTFGCYHLLIRRLSFLFKYSEDKVTLMHALQMGGLLTGAINSWNRSKMTLKNFPDYHTGTISKLKTKVVNSLC